MRQSPKIDYSHFTISLVKDPTEIHVLSVSSDKCSPVKLMFVSITKKLEI